MSHKNVIKYINKKIQDILRGQVDAMNAYYDQIDEIDRHSTLWDLTKIETSEKNPIPDEKKDNITSEAVKTE